MGDWIETNPVTHAEVVKFTKAVHFWAWHHGVRVELRSAKTGDGHYTVRVDLVSKHRIRNFK